MEDFFACSEPSEPVRVFCGQKMHDIVRDAAIITASGYTVDAGHFMKEAGHRFETVHVSNLPHVDGHFVVGEHVNADKNYPKITYLAVYASINKSYEDQWSIISEVGAVYAGYYYKTFSPLLHYLLDCYKLGHAIVICGHSVGGSLAQSLTLELLTELEKVIEARYLQLNLQHHL